LNKQFVHQIITHEYYHFIARRNENQQILQQLLKKGQLIRH
jgi:hypothetical protein